jgi:hypothetical protein
MLYLFNDYITQQMVWEASKQRNFSDFQTFPKNSKRDLKTTYMTQMGGKNEIVPLIKLNQQGLAFSVTPPIGVCPDREIGYIKPAFKSSRGNIKITSRYGCESTHTMCIVLSKSGKKIMECMSVDHCSHAVRVFLFETVIQAIGSRSEGSPIAGSVDELQP